jgi:hypothetical protein
MVGRRPSGLSSVAPSRPSLTEPSTQLQHWYRPIPLGPVQSLAILTNILLRSLHVPSYEASPLCALSAVAAGKVFIICKRVSAACRACNTLFLHTTWFGSTCLCRTN